MAKYLDPTLAGEGAPDKMRHTFSDDSDGSIESMLREVETCPACHYLERELGGRPPLPARANQTPDQAALTANYPIGGST